VTGKDFNLLQKIEFPNSRVKLLTLGQVLKMNLENLLVLREAVKISPKKLLAEQDLINSNKLLDESQDIAKVGVG
jgi:hypothetical protein